MNQKLIDTFRDYCENDKFYKFVLKINEQDKFLFWMEILWCEFCEQYPDFNYPFNELKEIFRFCPLHFEKLQQQEFKVIPGLLKLPDKYWKSKDILFPFGDTFIFSCTASEGDKCVIDVCTKCQLTAKEWIKNNNITKFITKKSR